MSPEPWVRTLSVSVPVPTSSDKRSDAVRVRDSLSRMGFDPVEFPLPILRKLPGALRQSGFSLPVALTTAQHGYVLSEIGKPEVYGIAIDIGSSNIECSLIAMDSGRKLMTSKGQNPQVSCATDVLGRAQHAMTGQAEKLSDLLIQGVNDLIGHVCRESGVATDDVLLVMLCGNTLMTHFFLRLDVSNIPVRPHVPAATGPLFTTAAEVGLAVNHAATVYVFPNVGSYVGGDVISGLLCADITSMEQPILFIDAGTNVEVAIGCREWIMLGAGAAGPALEDGVAEIGRQASSGTICGVRQGSSGELIYDIKDGTTPSGICASGMIDLIAALFAGGIINRAGKLDEAAEGVSWHDGEICYRIGSGEDGTLYLREREISSFLRSKAALFAFLYIFVRSLGLSFRDIPKMYVAGALGCGINLESAVSIGMLPDLPREKFVPLGNAALCGAEKLLLDRSLAETISGICEKITYREMSEERDFLQILQGGLFLPHTEPDILNG